MKRGNSILLVPAILATAWVWPICSVGAQAEGEKPETSIRPVGLTVALPDPDSEFSGSYIRGRHAGTTIHFRVTNPPKPMLNIDGDKTSVETFADSSGKDLQAEGFSGDPIGPFTTVSEDGKTMVFSLQARNVPSGKSTHIRVKGKIAVLAGDKEKTAKVPLTLKADTKIRLGTIEATLDKVGDANWGRAKQTLTFQADQPFDAIKEMVFFDADGKKVAHSIMGQGAMGWADNKTYEIRIGLEKKIDKGQLEVIYYSDTQILELPLDLKVSVGL
jgi:hypothetical protein